MLMNNNQNEMSKAGSTRPDNESVYSYKTDKTDMTIKSSVTAITYATEMLGDLVNKQ